MGGGHRRAVATLYASYTATAERGGIPRPGAAIRPCHARCEEPARPRAHALDHGILVTRFIRFETLGEGGRGASTYLERLFTLASPVYSFAPNPGRTALEPACTRGALALVVFVAALFAGCTRRADVIPSDVASEDLPDQETWDVALSLSMDGRPRALVRAPYLARFERADSTFARFGPATPVDTVRVVVQVYDDAGLPTATVEADRLLYFDEERRFVAEGRVVVRTETEKTLRSETLTWDEADHSLRTDGFVQIVTPEERLQGYRLVADEGLETYSLARITGQVTVQE